MVDQEAVRAGADTLMNLATSVGANDADTGSRRLDGP